MLQTFLVASTPQRHHAKRYPPKKIYFSQAEVLPRFPQAEVLPKAMSLALECCETSGMSSMINRNMIIRNGHSTSPELAHLIESKSIWWVSRQADFKDQKPPICFWLEVLLWADFSSWF